MRCYAAVTPPRHDRRVAAVVTTEEAAARRATRSARRATALQALANVGWPVASYATVAGHAGRLGLAGIAEMGVSGPFVVGLLPLTLVAWMQLAGGANVPLDLRGWALGFVAPVLVAVLASGGAGVGWVAFELGALYLAAFLAAYAWIVWVRPFRAGRYAAWPASERRFYWLAAALQGFFLVPGAVSLGIFAVVLAAGAEHSAWALAGYAAAWVGLTSHEVRWMNAAAWPP